MFSLYIAYFNSALNTAWLRNRPCDGRKAKSERHRLPRYHQMCNRYGTQNYDSEGRQWIQSSVEGHLGEGSRWLQPVSHNQKAQNRHCKTLLVPEHVACQITTFMFCKLAFTPGLNSGRCLTTCEQAEASGSAGISRDHPCPLWQVSSWTVRWGLRDVMNDLKYLNLNLTWPGIPLDILQHDHWVPGSTSRADLGKYQNKPLFKEILATTPSTCILYAKRATEDILCCSISWQLWLHVSFAQHNSFIVRTSWEGLPRMHRLRPRPGKSKSQVVPQPQVWHTDCTSLLRSESGSADWRRAFPTSWHLLPMDLVAS